MDVDHLSHGRGGIVPNKGGFRPDKTGFLEAKGDHGDNHGNKTLSTRFSMQKSETGETIFIYISIVSTLIFMAEMITIVVFKRCKKMPVTIKYLSINFLVSDALFHITGSLVSVIKLTNIVSNVVVMKISYRFATGLTLAVSFASVDLLAFDRLFATQIPIRYQSFITKYRVIFAIVCVWCFNILACLAVFIWLLIDCEGVKDVCSKNREFRVSFTSMQESTYLVLFIMYEILNAIAYLSLCMVLRKYFNRRMQQMSFSGQDISNINQASTSAYRLILTLTLLQLVLNLPYLIHTFLVVLIKDMSGNAWREYVRVISEALLRISSIGSLYLYTWKLKECKYVFLSMFCRRNGRYSETIKVLWREVYKIHVPNASSGQMSPSATTSSGQMSPSATTSSGQMSPSATTSSNSFNYSPSPMSSSKAFNFYN